MTTAFQSNAFQNDAFQIDAGAGNSQALAITLDDVTVSVSQVLEHSQALAITLDSITTSIAQTNVHSQSLAVTLDGVTFDASQTLSHEQSMAITLDSIDATINQSVASASKDQVLAITLDGVTVSIAQQGADLAPVITGGGVIWNVPNFSNRTRVKKTIEEVAKLELADDDAEIALRVRLKEQYKENHLKLERLLQEQKQYELDALKQQQREDVEEMLSEVFLQDLLEFERLKMQENYRRIAIIMMLA